VRISKWRRRPRGRILAPFDTQAEIFAQPEFSGYAFVTARVEASRAGHVEEAVRVRPYSEGVGSLALWFAEQREERSGAQSDESRTAVMP
jgi:hypothetical protein